MSKITNDGGNTNDRPFFDGDQALYKTFLSSEQNHGTRARKTFQLQFFYDWSVAHYPGIHSILDVTPLQFREYFQYVNDHVQGQLSVKNKYRTTVKQFIYWIIRPLIAVGDTIKYNYEVVFEPAFLPMRDTGSRRNEEPFSKADVTDCLNFFRTRNEQYYLIFALLAYTGMRVGGVVNIEIDKIDFENRFIWTQEKQTKATTGSNMYPIPLSFVNTLKGYVMQYQQLSPKENFLFPLATGVIRKQLRKWRNEAHPHLFRDALNSRWMEQGLDEGVRALLLNQKPKSVNADHYLKILRSWKARLEFYDKYFPY